MPEFWGAETRVKFLLHEMRAPIQAVRADVALLHDRTEVGHLDPDAILRAARRIGVAAAQLDAIAEGQFILSADDIHLNLRDTAIARIVSDATHLLGERAIAGRLRSPDICFDVDGCGTVVADADRLRLALSAILDNALRYSLAGASVAIAGERSEYAIVLRVRSHSIGIPEGDEERIFEPFFRCRNAVELQRPGLGVGLTIARRIVEKHGGTLTLTQREAPTEFAMQLPVTGRHDQRAK